MLLLEIYYYYSTDNLSGSLLGEAREGRVNPHPQVQYQSILLFHSLLKVHLRNIPILTSITTPLDNKS